MNNSRVPLVALLPLFASWSSAQTTLVTRPSIKPAAITAGIPTMVTVRALVVGAGHRLLPNSVNLLFVDQNGSNPRIIGVLNDNGVSGDAIAGDGIFGGAAMLNHPSSGQIYLRVSAAFQGVVTRTLSPIVTVLVIGSGVPNSPRPMQLSRTTTDFQTGATVICDELLITLQPNIPPPSLSSIIAPIGGTLVGILPELGVYQVAIPMCDAGSLNAARKTIETNPLVSSVSVDAIVGPAQITNNPNDPAFRNGDQWGLTKVNALGAWSFAEAYGLTGGVPVAILDSGINSGHIDLAGSVSPEGVNWCAAVDTAGNCTAVGVGNMGDSIEHGTAVAGIAAAITNNNVGVASPAYNALIIPEKIAGPSGETTAATIAEAIYDAVFKCAKVINISYGRRKFTSRQEERAIQDALNSQVVVVAAAGNYGDYAIPFYPAAYGGVIAVGASDQNDQRSLFSDPVEPGSNYGPGVTLYAPGSGISVLPSQDNSGYLKDAANGTSFAAPLVTGAASLLLALKGKVNPGHILTPSEVKEILVCSAEVIGVDATGSTMRRLDMFRAAQIVASGQTNCAGVYQPSTHTLFYLPFDSPDAGAPEGCGVITPGLLSFVSDRFGNAGKAIHVDGTGSPFDSFEIQCHNTKIASSGSQSATVGYWIRMSQPPAGGNCSNGCGYRNLTILASNSDNGGCRKYLVTQIDNGGFPDACQGGANGNIGQFISKTSTVDGKWHNFVWVFDHTNKALNFYLDGVQNGTGPLPDPSYAAQNFQAVAGAENTSFALNGDLDDLWIEDHAWTPAEVARYFRTVP